MPDEFNQGTKQLSTPSSFHKRLFTLFTHDCLNRLLIGFVAKQLESSLIASTVTHSLADWLRLRQNYDYLHRQSILLHGWRLNDRPVAMQSRSVTRNRCLTTVQIGTASLSTPMMLTAPIIINPEKSLLWNLDPGRGPTHQDPGPSMKTRVGLHSRLFSWLIVIGTVDIIGVLSDQVPIYRIIYIN